MQCPSPEGPHQATIRQASCRAHDCRRSSSRGRNADIGEGVEAPWRLQSTPRQPRQAVSSKPPSLA